MNKSEVYLNLFTYKNILNIYVRVKSKRFISLLVYLLIWATSQLFLKKKKNCWADEPSRFLSNYLG